MKQSVSRITLGISDYVRAKSFYATLGWSPALEIEETEIAHNPGFGLAADGSVLLGERA